MREKRLWQRYTRFWGADPLRDVDDELRFHLETKRDALRAAGVPEQEVEAVLRREFGDVARIERELKEIGMKRVRRSRRADVVDELRSDLLQAWRSFSRRPAVPIVAVLTLGLGIGAGTAVFSLVDAVLLNPLPVERADQLFAVTEDDGLGFSYPMSQHLREYSTTTASLAGYVGGTGMALRRGTEVEQAQGALVTGNYFQVLGVRPQHGRLLLPSDEGEPGATRHVVISDAYWQRTGADPAIVGSTIHVNDEPFTVVGVAPPRFRGTSLSTPVDLWLPVTMMATVGRSGIWANPDALTTWHFTIIEHVARVTDPASAERMAAELTSLHRAAMAEMPKPAFSLGPDEPATVTAQPLTEASALRSRDDLIRFLNILAAVVAVVLGIACVNVANLMLMRATERAREMSLRAALGATGRRVARQLLVESFALALAAATVGVLVALAAMKTLALFTLPGGIALSELHMPLDGRVLLFTAGAATLCALLFGTAPAVRGARADMMDTLRSAVDGVRGGRWHAGNMMVAVQVALCMMLLVGGGLLVRSLQQALSVDLGFRTDGVVTATIAMRQHGYDDARADVLLTSLLETAARQPGITATAAATRVPVEQDAFRMPIEVQGAEGEPPSIPLVVATPGFLELMHIPVLRGRTLLDTDRSETQEVAVVSEAAAERLWPGEDPIGRQFVALFGNPITVVGVVADVHYTSLEDREPVIYLPFMQKKGLGATSSLRLVAAGPDGGAALTALRDAVRSTDPGLTVFQERDVRRHMAAVLMPQRFGVMLLGAFAVLGLLMSAVGIYAVAAYDVARRERELGIRAALGAGRRELVHIVVGRAAVFICGGVLVGLALSALATGMLRVLLFDTEPWHPAAYTAAVLLLGAVAGLATWLPARRAAAADPLEVIRG